MGRNWNMCREFKYLGCVLDESRLDGAEYRKKALVGKKVVGAIR